jgi:hypothetical protein
MRSSTLLFSLLVMLIDIAKSSRCRYLATDNEWPSASDWRNLNSSLNGQLIATVPLASVCHDPTYDDEKCVVLQQTWGLSQTQWVTPWSLTFIGH